MDDFNHCILSSFPLSVCDLMIVEEPTFIRTLMNLCSEVSLFVLFQFVMQESKKHYLKIIGGMASDPLWNHLYSIWHI